MTHNWSKYQLAIFDNAENGEGNTVVEALAGSAKCLGEGTPVLMFDASIKSVEEIQPNELLMGPDSKPRRVLKTNSGFGDLVKIIPIKGDSWFSVAFNVKIVDELKKKISNTKNGQISTIHSYGLKCLYKTFDKVTVDQDKTSTLIAKTLGKKIKDKNVMFLKK